MQNQQDWTYKLVACLGEQFLWTPPHELTPMALPTGTIGRGESFADAAQRIGVVLDGVLRVERCNETTSFVFTGRVQSPPEAKNCVLLTLQDLNEIEISQEDGVELCEYLARPTAFPLEMFSLD